MHKELIEKLITMLDFKKNKCEIDKYKIYYDRTEGDLITLYLYPPFNLDIIHRINVIADTTGFNAIVKTTSYLNSGFGQSATVDIILSEEH